MARRELTPAEEARNRRIAFALAAVIVAGATLVFLAVVVFVVVTLIGAIS